jgi:hypothetical protein
MLYYIIWADYNTKQTPHYLCCRHVLYMKHLISSSLRWRRRWAQGRWSRGGSSPRQWGRRPQGSHPRRRWWQRSLQGLRETPWRGGRAAPMGRGKADGQGAEVAGGGQGEGRRQGAEDRRRRWEGRKERRLAAGAGKTWLWYHVEWEKP